MQRVHINWPQMCEKNTISNDMAHVNQLTSEFINGFSAEQNLIELKPINSQDVLNLVRQS